MEHRRDIVAIGASRGGIEALCQVFRSCPGDLPAVFLVVLHTGAQSLRLLPEIVGRSTKLRAAYADEGAQMMPGHVYFAPPDRHMLVQPAETLHLSEGPKVNYTRPAVDPLFQSVAAVYGSRVIGVVLTGGDGDGTAGLRAIKAAGGLSVIQRPDEAADPSMPESALRGDSPDFIVPLSSLGDLLSTIIWSGSHNQQNS
jgi:two-component system chemotaxis response regulator CheB